MLDVGVYSHSEFCEDFESMLMPLQSNLRSFRENYISSLEPEHICAEKTDSSRPYMYIYIYIY